MKVLLIIPAYNEEDSIEATVNRVKKAGFDYIVINDGSTDQTAKICEENDFQFLNLPVNLGIGGSIQVGHLFALRNNYDVDIQFDGDGQHDIRSIPMLLRSIEQGSDLVIGSRFINESNTFRTTLMRRMGSRWLRTIIRIICGLHVTDPTSGFRACNRHAIELFAANYPLDYPEPESLVEARKRSLKITEVPVIMHERQGGESSISPLRGIYYMIKVTLAIIVAGLGSISK